MRTNVSQTSAELLILFGEMSMFFGEMLTPMRYFCDFPQILAIFVQRPGSI
jgi:hypothetical protein